MVVFSRYEGRYGCLSWAKPVVASFQEDFRSFILLFPLKCELAVVTSWFNSEYVTLRYKVCPVSLFFGVKRVGPSGANVSSRSSDFAPRSECFVVAVWRLVWGGSRTASMVAAASLTVCMVRKQRCRPINTGIYSLYSLSCVGASFRVCFLGVYNELVLRPPRFKHVLWK